MEILVATNHLDNIGGSQTYTYAIIAELLRLGHNVEYFTYQKGFVSDKIEKLGVRFMTKQHYDLIIANHKPVVQYLFQYGYIIQTTHGIIPGIEEPSCFADFNVCVSSFQQKYFSGMKMAYEVIPNGIDCERFFPEKPLNEKLTNVLSLCQSKEADKLVELSCRKINVGFRNFKDRNWNIEKEINKADLVVGVGRSLFDAMACGRTVISYDTRYADRNFEGDGYLDKNNVNSSLEYNCCGGFNRRFFTVEDFIVELKKYNSCDGIFMREFALNELNIKKSVEKYLAIYDENKNKQDKKRLIACYNELYTEINELKSSKYWGFITALREVINKTKKSKQMRRVKNIIKKAK